LTFPPPRDRKSFFVPPLSGTRAQGLLHQQISFLPQMKDRTGLRIVKLA
jgi:hypothetical protein